MAEKIVKDSQGLAKELVNGVKEFEELKVIDLNGRPYYSIIYLENGNEFEGYASYNLKVISEYLKRHFGFAQPETHDKRTEKHACDCISRQAAIDATWFEPSYTDPLNVLTEVRDRLKALPSAQPERRKGRWRKGGCECGYYWAKDAPISSVPNFCPQCGADMRIRGEQNG